MPQFQDHINQAKSNLDFLAGINQKFNTSHDWQVTVAFYVGVHLIRAHLVKTMGMHYTSHTDVRHAINVENKLSLGKLPEDVYLAYEKLELLARRSRYLCIDASKLASVENAFFTHDKHAAKAIRNLDTVLGFIAKKYHQNFKKNDYYCLELSSKAGLQYFVAKNPAELKSHI